MLDRDLFVGLVAVGLGAWLCYGSLMGDERIQRITLAQVLTLALGAWASRWIIGLVGFFVLLVGVWLIRGRGRNARRGVRTDK